MTGDPERLRAAAEAGDRRAAEALVRELAASGRAAEADYWRNRLWSAPAGAAVRLGRRRYAPSVLVAVASVAGCALVCVALVGLFGYIALSTDEDLLIVLMVVLGLLPAVWAATLLWSAYGMLRGSAAAARRASLVTATAAGLVFTGASWVTFVGVPTSGDPRILPVFVPVAVVVVAGLAGLSVLLLRCVPRLAVGRVPR